MKVLVSLSLLCAAVLSAEAGECNHFGQACDNLEVCSYSYDKPLNLSCGKSSRLGPAENVCRFGGTKCPDGKQCGLMNNGERRCVFLNKPSKCKKYGETCGVNGDRQCYDCYRRKGLCCRQKVPSLPGNTGLEGYGCLPDPGSHKCPDGKECIIKDGKLRCAFMVTPPGCWTYGQICGVNNDRNCIPCYRRSGFCCRPRALLGDAAQHCMFGGNWCPENMRCNQTYDDGITYRDCIRNE